MSVITISRQMGSLGEEIAQEVSGKLQYEYLDRDGIEQGLTTHGLAVPEVEKFDEKSLHFWVKWQIQGQKFFHAMQTVIYEAARRDNVVIVGRGGQVLLKGIPGVLHVRIIAPLQDRVRRLAVQRGGNEKELLRILKQSDRDSVGFIRTFFDVDWENADLYDLTINTRDLSVDVAVDMILSVVPAVDAMKDIQRSRERLDDLILQQKVETVLLTENISDIRVEVAKGVVTLGGSAPSSLEGQRYVSLVSEVEGVQKVENNMIIRLPTSM
ncbi:MAG: cytidylate kinase family protein [Deltaproteobacteria bacterium]|nr:cytidylate kinase family protein [Deltaproteobacteria bacterium]